MSTFTLANQSLELWLWAARTVGLMIGLGILALALKHWQRSQERDAQRVFEQLDLMRSELLWLQERVTHQEPQPIPVPKVTARVRAEPPAPPPAPVPMAMPAVAPRGYEVAARLARSGATADELISSCGLSRHEAQLLIRLHAAPAAMSTPKTEAAPAPVARRQEPAPVKATKPVIDRRPRALAVG